MNKLLPDLLNDDNLYVASSSLSQYAGHADTLWNHLQVNNENHHNGTRDDYKALFIGSKEDCHQFLENL